MRSDLMKSGVDRIPHRALFRALGLTDEELSRPIIGVVSAKNEIIPGHMHLDKISEAVKAGIRMAGGTPIEFPAIGVCDGIAMNHEGMFFSLPSREHIADSVEIMANAHPFDGLVFIPNCDKIVPGMIMAALRVNIPSIFCSGGPMMPGKANGHQVALTDAFEAPGAVRTGKMTEAQAQDIVEHSCPGCGSCAGMFTANSMNCMTELLGLGLPGNGTIPAVESQRILLAKHAGMKIMELVEKNLRPRDIVTEKAIKNGLAADMALGCSTNTMLHLPAIAHEAGLEFDLKGVNAVSDAVPHLVKLNPAGVHCLVDLNNAGGLSAVMKRLDGLGLIDPTAKTVDGTWADRIAKAEIVDENVIRDKEHAYSQTGGLAILYGNLAPDGAVVKKGAVLPEMLVHTGPAKCFDSEEACCEGLYAGKVVAGDVVVVRYEGPKSGHARDAEPHRDAGRYGSGFHLRSGDGRPVLRREPRRVHRPCVSRGGGQRIDGLCSGWRPDRHRHPQPLHPAAGERRRARKAQGRDGSPASQAGEWLPQALPRHGDLCQPRRHSR